MEAFRDAQFFGMRMPSEIQPRLVVEAGTLYHQRVSVPMSDRVALPCGIRILGKLAAIGQDLAKLSVLRQKCDDSRRLQNLRHVEAEERADFGQAKAGKIDAEVFAALPVERLRPFLYFARFQVRGHIDTISGRARLPDAGKVRLAVRRLS